MSTLTTIVAAILVGLAVFYLVFMAMASLTSYIRGVGDEAEEAGFESVSTFGKIFDSWSNRLSPFLSESFRFRTSRSIIKAGGLGGLSVEKFGMSVIVSFFVAVFVALVIVIVMGWSPMWVLASSVVGASFPFIWLRDQVESRHQEILSTLPYHLDLLTLCVEAGLDFNAGVSRTVEKGKEGALVEEFQSYLMELRLGKTRIEALQGMSDRVGLTAFSTFLSALMQADRMGTNLGKTLRIQSEQLRIERFQRAEKLANEAPVKMILPLVLFIFPTIWIILGGPLIFEWLFK